MNLRQLKSVEDLWDSDNKISIDLNDNLVGANEKETPQALAEQPQMHAQPQQPEAQVDSDFLHLPQV